MERHKERLSPEAVLLDKYLNSYNRCKNRKRAAFTRYRWNAKRQRGECRVCRIKL